MQEDYMKRREFLKKAGVVAASATIAPLMFANAQRGSLRWELVSSFPQGLDTIFGGAQDFARIANELSGGQIEITVYPAGAQVGGFEVYDAVSSGAFQMAHSAAYYFVGRRAAHGMFTSLPFGMNAQQQMAWIEQGGGQELWDELNAPDNLISFNLGNTGTQMGGWFKRRIDSPADLQGLSIRTAGLVGEVYRKAGANVQSLPGGEIFLALDRGAIDAADWVGPYDDEKLGLNRAAPYYYTPGWQEPSAMLNLYVNLELWNSLDANLQSAIHNAARSATTLMLAKYDANNGPALQRLIASGTEVLRFPTEVLDNFKRFAAEVHAEKAAADPFFARAFASFQAFQDNVVDWHATSEGAWHQYVYGA
jgi:TRAP-type mannitol/chloroaromatic compound transport system substrate-binding protein